MYGLSRTWLFGVSTAVAVGAIALLAWRVFEQSPRFFSRAPAPQSTIASPQPLPEPTLALKGASGDRTGGASISNMPKFDLVRVEPTGEAVIAGRASPGASVRLLNNGLVIAQVKADENGQFAIVPPVLPRGDHLLTLQIEGQPVSPQAQTVAVAVPADGKGEVVVALAEPGIATRILSDRAPAANNPAPGTPAPVPVLAIRSVDVDEAGGFYATGSGAPGSIIRLSLNGVVVASVQTGEEGRWSLKIERGLNAGAYAVRADQVDAAGKLLAQAEVPFDYPGRRQQSAATTTPLTTPEAVVTPPSGGPDAVVSEVHSVTVQRGDSLWRISQRMLGDGTRYTQIYAANNGQIRNPALIYPKQILVVPPPGRTPN